MYMKCKCSTTKTNISRFVKTFRYGAHASNRSEAIRASRCAIGLSFSGLPAEIQPRLQLLRRSDINMIPD